MKLTAAVGAAVKLAVAGAIAATALACTTTASSPATGTPKTVAVKGKCRIDAERRVDVKVLYAPGARDDVVYEVYWGVGDATPANLKDGLRFRLREERPGADGTLFTDALPVAGASSAASMAYSGGIKVPHAARVYGDFRLVFERRGDRVACEGRTKSF
jgi:hypothetical protein